MPPPSRQGLEVLVTGIGALLVQLLATRLLATAIETKTIGAAQFALLYLIIPAAAAVLWIWFMLVWRETNGWQSIGFTKGRPGWRKHAVVTGLASILAGILIVNVLAPVLGQPRPLPFGLAQQPVSVTGLLAIAFAVAVAAPLIEEMLFRGVLFGWLRRRQSLIPAAAIAAFAHAIIHLDLAAMPPLVAIFIMYGVLYEKTGTLWAPIVAHGIHNAVSLSFQLGNV